MKRNSIFIFLAITFAFCLAGKKPAPEQLKDVVQFCFQDSTSIESRIYLRVNKKEGLLQTSIGEFFETSFSFLDSVNFQSQKLTTTIYLVKNCKPFEVKDVYENQHKIYNEYYLAFSLNSKISCNEYPCIETLVIWVNAKPHFYRGKEGEKPFENELTRNKSLEEFIEEFFQIRNLAYENLHG